MILTGKRGASSPAEAEKKKPTIKHALVEGSFACDHEGYEGLDHCQVGETDMERDGWQLQGSPRHRGGRNSPNRTTRSYSEVARQGASRQLETNKSMRPNPEFLHRHTFPVYRVRNEEAFRDEVEVEISTINGEPFRGSLTRLEAKHLIYKGVLGCPFSNFRGCKLGFKGCPTVVFMLKEQINIDDLESVKDFSVKRSNTKQGQLVEDVLEGRVKGVRTVTE
jgi:hypothetical protein